MSESVREPSLVSELFDRGRLTVIFAVLLVEFALFFAGLFTPISVSTERTLANATSSQFGPLNSSSPVQLVALIFAHNLRIALVEMIPALGVLLFIFSVYGTGLAAQALAFADGLPNQWGAVIFAFPYSLVELSAYAIAVGSGIMLLLAWRRRNLRREIRVLLLELLVVALVLFVAAAMEATTIRISFQLGFALWLPTGLALAAVIVFSRRRRI